MMSERRQSHRNDERSDNPARGRHHDEAPTINP